MGGVSPDDTDQAGQEAGCDSGSGRVLSALFYTGIRTSMTDADVRGPVHFRGYMRIRAFAVLQIVV